MSQHSSESSLWSFINKVLAVVFTCGAGVFPASFVWAGIQLSIARHGPVQVAQARTTPTTVLEASAAPAAAPAATAPTTGGGDAAFAAQIAEGQKTYMMVCFACHQPTGLGMPNLFPPLAGTDWVNAPKPDRIIRNVLHGVMGPIKINGSAFTSAAPMMPPQGAMMSDKQIADVLTYARNSWGNKASAVSPDQVKAIREAEKARTAMWTEAELLKIPDR